MPREPSKSESDRAARSFRWFFTFGLGKEWDYFVENLSMLISGGMPIMDALTAIGEEARSRRMKNVIARIQSDIESGSPLWRTLGNTNLFPEHAVSLIRLGEESGSLTENLNVVAIEQEKERVFKSKLRSAMMYPLFVLSLTAIIGIGIAWFILPKLAVVFSQLNIPLPLITKVLIGLGIFLGNHGAYAVPAALVVLVAVFFFVFSFSKTKFIGQFFLFSAPGIKRLIKEVEVARFGYLLGTLLQAGLPITSALDSLASATEIAPYRALYRHLSDSVKDGDSIHKSFASFERTSRLVPAPIQQLIVAGERSGTLSGTLLKIGQMFEAKTDTSTKNLAVILEPILLVVVWLGVVAVALAVILPIYSLVGGFNAGTQTETSAPSVSAEATSEAQSDSTGELPAARSPVELEATTTAERIVEEPSAATLKILKTPTGWLRVRSEPALRGDILGQVLPGEIFEFRNTQNGWYEIVLSNGTTGWVSGTYIEVLGSHGN